MYDRDKISHFVDLNVERGRHFDKYLPNKSIRTLYFLLAERKFLL